ncbi:hypothetical protein [Methylobacterium sp. P1-11]|uniref:hypothetical protein n=1 Tax=Methylobacterium sp. P1-11 TaxID=2024616 RepID=UPI0015670E03|nr:hypothetical protein [Methylobacterium sp. P1-11]
MDEDQEIEITPEMITAGEDVLYGSSWSAGNEETACDLAEQVYRAMQRVRKPPLEGDA